MKLIALGALVSTAGAISLPSTGKVPFSRTRSLGARNGDGTVNWDWLSAEIEQTVRKYDPHPELFNFIKLGSHSKRDNKGKVSLYDQASGGVDTVYYGPAWAGAARPQAFMIDFDTGSSDLWVPGQGCTGCTGQNEYNGRGKNLGNKTTITYGSGQVSGANYVDAVKVGGYTVKNQTFVSVTNATGFDTSAAAGLMGLAFSSIASTKATPFFFNLLAQGQLPQPQFSFYLGRAASNTQYNGQLFFGGADSTLYTGSFTSVPVISQNYWRVAVGGAAVNGKVLPSTSGFAAVDTGTSLVLVPINTANAIYNAIPGAGVYQATDSESIHYFPCNTTATIAFNLAGKNFAINPLDTSLGAIGGGNCAGSIIGANIVNMPNFSILGDTFLKNWYSTFTYSPTMKKAFVKLAKAIGG